MKSGFIAIVGRPNSGKSTLLNSVLKSKVSIVTPKAQTTRERVLGILTEREGQIVFIDTPGIHRAREGGINAYMMSEVRGALEEPNLVWYLVDPSSTLEHEKPVLEILKQVGAETILLMNKVDRVGKQVPRERFETFERELLAQARELGVKVRSVKRISAQDGKELGGLLEESWTVLPEGPLYYEDPDQISDRPVRFFVAEKIREQLFMKLGEELPYSCAVEIQSFEETTKPIRIQAVIYVERESQKGIVVGKGGAKIKEIGQAARQEIEEFVGAHVFLGLTVKVLKDWTKDAKSMKQLGYFLPTEKAS